jgi:uncharacterized protein (TIGR02265 family)
MTATSAAAEKLVYAPVFSALAKGLATRMTPAFLEETKRLGVNFNKLLPGYPYPVFEQTILAATKLIPEKQGPDAIAEIGRIITLATIDESPVGKALLPLLRVMGTGRALRRVYLKSTGENYNKVSFGIETPKSLEMSMSDVGNIPDMARGSVLGMGEAMGIPLRARIASFEAPKVTYLIEWD